MSNDEKRKSGADLPSFNPHINAKKALNEVKLDFSSIPDLESLGYETEDDLFEAMADALADSASNKEHDTNFYLEQIEKHVGVNATHKKIKEMKGYFRYIFGRIQALDENMQDNKSEDSASQQICWDRHSILDQMAEGIDLCTDGYANRLFDLQRTLRFPATLDALLVNYRLSLIEKVFLQLIIDIKKNPDINENIGMEAHLKRECYTIANKNGYNVPVPPFDDAFIPREGDRNNYITQFQKPIKERLHLALYHQYGPWHMINFCREQITQQAGYRGRDQRGYKAHTYNKINHNIEKYLAEGGNSEAKEDDFKITILVGSDKMPRVIDIDLKKLTSRLWGKFTKEGYIKFPTETLQIEPVSINHITLHYYTSRHAPQSRIMYQIKKKGEEAPSVPQHACFLLDLPIDEFGSNVDERLEFLAELYSKVAGFKEDVAAIYDLPDHVDIFNRMHPAFALFIIKKHHHNTSENDLTHAIKEARGTLKILLAEQLLCLQERTMRLTENSDTFQFFYQAFEHDQQRRMDLIATMGIQQYLVKLGQTERQKTHVLKMLSIIHPSESRRLFKTTSSRAFWIHVIRERILDSREVLLRVGSSTGDLMECLHLFWHLNPSEKFDFLLQESKENANEIPCPLMLVLSIGVRNLVLAKKATRQMFLGMSVVQKCRIINYPFGKNHETFLMLAAVTKIPGIMTILLRGLSDSARGHALMQQATSEKRKKSVFLYAAQTLPSHIRDIDQLSTRRQQIIFRQQKNGNKDTVLMSLIRTACDPESITLLLAPLSISDRLKIQRDRDSKGETPLMLSARLKYPGGRIKAQMAGLPSSRRVCLLCDKNRSGETAGIIVTKRRSLSAGYLALFQGISYSQRSFIEKVTHENNDIKKIVSNYYLYDLHSDVKRDQPNVFLGCFLTLNSLMKQITKKNIVMGLYYNLRGSGIYSTAFDIRDVILPMFAIADYVRTDKIFLEFLRKKYRKNEGYKGIIAKARQRGFAGDLSIIETYFESKDNDFSFKNLRKMGEEIKPVNVFLRKILSKKKKKGIDADEKGFLDSISKKFNYFNIDRDSLSILLVRAKENGVEIQANQRGLNILMGLLGNLTSEKDLKKLLNKFSSACMRMAQKNSERRWYGVLETKPEEVSIDDLKKSAAKFSKIDSVNNTAIVDEIIREMTKISSNRACTAKVFNDFAAFAYPNTEKMVGNKSESKQNKQPSPLVIISRLFDKASGREKNKLIDLLRRHEKLDCSSKEGMSFLLTLSTTHLKKLLKNNQNRLEFIRLINNYLQDASKNLAAINKNDATAIIIEIDKITKFMACLKKDECVNTFLWPTDNKHTILSALMLAARDVFTAALSQFSSSQLSVLFKQSNQSGHTAIMSAVIDHPTYLSLLLKDLNPAEKTDALNQTIPGRPEQTILAWITSGAPEMLRDIYPAGKISTVRSERKDSLERTSSATVTVPHVRSKQVEASKRTSSGLFSSGPVGEFITACTLSQDNHNIFEEKIKPALMAVRVLNLNEKSDSALCIKSLQDILVLAKSHSVTFRCDGEGLQRLTELFKQINVVHISNKSAKLDHIIGLACHDIIAKQSRESSRAIPQPGE